MRGRRAVLSLGANLGDRLGTLQAAVDALARTPGVRVTAVSSVYETSPVGGPAQPDFLNAAVLADASLPPLALLDRALQLETELGRVRAARWGPRVIDIDLIVVGEAVLDSSRLVLPHPRAAARAFVLSPWHELEHDAVLPGAGPVTDLLAGLLAGLPPAGLRRRAELSLRHPVAGTTR